MIKTTLSKISDFLKSRPKSADPDLLGSSILGLIYDNGDQCDYVQVKFERRPEISIVSGNFVYDFNDSGDFIIGLPKSPIV